jgi:hypothetical protein
VTGGGEKGLCLLPAFSYTVIIIFIIYLAGLCSALKVVKILKIATCEYPHA